MGEYREIKESHEGFEFVYTDGSHIENSSAAATVRVYHIHSERLPKHTTIFSAEMLAIFPGYMGRHVEEAFTQKVLERHHRLSNQHKKHQILFYSKSHWD